MAADDDSVWQEFVKDIKPIRHPEKVFEQKKPKLRVTPKISSHTVYHGEGLSELEIGNFNNIDANTAARFKKGEFRVEGELDLHGYTEKNAFDAVVEFIKLSYLRKKRCIAIITGKGKPRESDDIFAARGVLREIVPQWLNLQELRPLILAINHPAPNDGGNGAIRIFLRRQR